MTNPFVRRRVGVWMLGLVLGACSNTNASDENGSSLRTRADLSQPVDMAKAADLAQPVDLARPVDLAQPAGDMATTATSPPGAEGVYKAYLYAGTYPGNVSHGDQRMIMLVLENGELWGAYGGTAVYQPFPYPTGMLHAQMTVGAPVGDGVSTYITTPAMKSFNPSATAAENFVGNFQKLVVAGNPSFEQHGFKMMYGNYATGGVLNFDCELYYYDYFWTAYNYLAAPSLAYLSGSWSIKTQDNATLALTIAAGGTVSGTLGTCSVSGTVAPRASGKNVFDVSLSYSGSCAQAGQARHGVAITHPGYTAGTQELLLMTVDAANGSATVAFGSR